MAQFLYHSLISEMHTVIFVFYELQKTRENCIAKGN